MNRLLSKEKIEMYHFHSTLVATDAYSSAWWSWPFMVSPQGYVPRWFDISYLPNSVVSTISVFGNPAVWWVGFASMLVVAERAIRGKELLQLIKKKLARKSQVSEEQIQLPNLVATSASASEQPVDTPPPITEQAIPPTDAIANSATQSSTKRKWELAAIFIATVFFFSWIPYVFISRITYIYHFYVSMPFLCLASTYLINKYWNTKQGKVVTIVFFAAAVVMFAAFYPVISGAPVSTSWTNNLKWFPSWFFAP